MAGSACHGRNRLSISIRLRWLPSHEPVEHSRTRLGHLFASTIYVLGVDSGFERPGLAAAMSTG